MDRGFAILVLNACYRASREIGEMGTMVADFSSEDEGKHLKSQMGMAIAEIGRITDAIYKVHPDLHRHVETHIEQYGRLS